MTVIIDPITMSTLILLLVSSITVLVWIGRLSNRVDRLGTDVAELKDGQKQILQLMHHHIGYHQCLNDAPTPTTPPS